MGTSSKVTLADVSARIKQICEDKGYDINWTLSEIEDRKNADRFRTAKPPIYTFEVVNAPSQTLIVYKPETRYVTIKYTDHEEFAEKTKESVRKQFNAKTVALRKK